MQALIETDIAGFVDLALPWAAREPVLNNVLTTQAEAVRDGRRSYDNALWITVLDNGGDVVGAAMHTPPYNLFVCPMPVDAAQQIAEAIAMTRARPAGVSGDTATAREFVRAWQDAVGASARPGMAARIYRLDAVVPPPPVAGWLRVAERVDHDLLVDWINAFLREAVPGEAHDDVAGVMDGVLADQGGYLWEVDGRPVCYAAARLPAAGVSRIGPVYTPPAHRRRGYAGACVAEVSQRTLDAGAKLCALYTDLSNPTSNGVYQRLGYQPVGDSQEYIFTY